MSVRNRPSRGKRLPLGLLLLLVIAGALGLFAQALNPDDNLLQAKDYVLLGLGAVGLVGLTVLALRRRSVTEPVPAPNDSI